MLTEWDREKLRQALGPDTGDTVGALFDELGNRLASVETQNEELIRQLGELVASQPAPPVTPSRVPTTAAPVSAPSHVADDASVSSGKEA